MAEAHAQRDRPASVSPIASLVRWLQVKNYQYEVTTSLYMLTSTEKIVFNSILFVLISLLVTAAYLYLPAHMFIIYSRVWYYISGEFTHSHSAAGDKNMLDAVIETLKASKDSLVVQTATSFLAKQSIGAASMGRRDEI